MDELTTNRGDVEGFFSVSVNLETLPGHGIAVQI